MDCISTFPLNPTCFTLPLLAPDVGACDAALPLDSLRVLKRVAGGEGGLVEVADVGDERVEVERRLNTVMSNRGQHLL